VGIELNPDHAAFAREHCGLEVHEQVLEDAPLERNSFDAILLFEVFEHLPEPLRFLEQCRAYLKPEGTLYIEVPNLDEVLLQVYGIPEFASFYYRAPHIYYYTERTLRAVLEKAGYAGKTGFAQGYSLFNHVHWLLSHRPQASQASAVGVPSWSPIDPSKHAISEKIHAWLGRADAEYRELLVDAGVAEIVSFEGTSVS
jgi:SAM-dependent methyltransferase